MKYFILLLIIAFFFPKSFVTYPGYTTAELYKQWESSKKHCYGFVYQTKEVLVDSVEKDICFGMPL